MNRPAARLAAALVAGALLVFIVGLMAGSEGWALSVQAWQRDAADLVWPIRAPRTLGALAAGALLGLAGALAQGLFRNPLADPFLLGAAAGAGLAVTAVLAALAVTLGPDAGALGTGALQWLRRSGLVGAAFIGALGGVALSLGLARGAGRPMVLLLAGVVAGVLMTALADLITLLVPEALRGRQLFMLGSTALLDWGSVAVMTVVLAVALPLAVRCAAVLDALVLGESTAASLGLPLPALRAVLVAVLALATGAAVAQAGLVAFVGLVAPHLVRRWVAVRHGALLGLSALAGAVLLGAADVISRSVIAPRELPVGLLTAIFGGAYLLVLLRRRMAA